MRPGSLSRRSIIVLIAVLVLVLVSGAAYAYVMLDWFKNPKTIYLQSELKEIQKMNSIMSDTDAKYKELVASYLDKPVHTTTQLSNLTFEAMDVNPEVSKVLELIKDAKLQTDLQVDDKNKKAYDKIKLMLKDKPIIQLELFNNQDKLGLSVPDLYNKYAVIDLKESEKVKKDLKIPESFPNKIISYNDLINAIKISPEELKPILLDYGKFYSDSIDPKQVTIKKDAIFEEEGVKLSSRELTVTFTENQFRKLVVSASDKFSNDKRLQDILFTRYQNVSRLLKDSGYKVEEMSKETFTEKVKDAHFDLKDAVDKLRFNEDVKMVIQIDRKGNILSRTISTNVSSQDVKGRNAIVFKTDGWTDKDSKSRLFSFRTRSDQGEGGEVSVSYSNQNQNKENKGKVDVSLKETKNDHTNTVFSFHNDFTIKDNNKQKDGDFAFKASFNSSGGEQEISGSLYTTVAPKENGQNSDYRIKLNVDKLMGSSGLKTISFKLSNEVEYGNDIQLPSLTPNNSIDLVHMTDADKIKAQQEIMKGIDQFTQKNAELLQSYFPYMAGTGKNSTSTIAPNSSKRSLSPDQSKSPATAPLPAAQKGASEEPAPGLKITKYTISVAKPKENISYPEIDGLKDAAVQKKINESLKAIAVPKQDGDIMDGSFPYEYTADYKVQYVKGNILNLIFNAYTYTGGAHGMPDKISYIVNLENGQTYKLSDLFNKNSNYKEKVSALIKAMSINRDFKLNGFQSIEDKDSFYLDDKGIIVYFQPYQYTPYAAGFPEFQIPYEKLDSLVNKEGDFWKAMGR